jgi:tungstate transport system substrate-binding protein
MSAGKTPMRPLLCLLAALVFLAGCAATPYASSSLSKPTASAPREVILATTTSTRDSGLLDVLLPLFEERTGYRVKPIAVGSGQAMVMGERGEADVLLVHAPDAEEKFMAAGHGINRRRVMHNDFVLVGPPSDPAGVRALPHAGAALRRIAETGNLFVSRGDHSGTHQLEMKLWREAGLAPAGQRWYQETGQGMGETLRVASEKGAYTLTDRATYLANRPTLALSILVEKDEALLNVYHVIQVNPQKSDRINAAGGRAFVEFMISPETQRLIGEFGIEKFGQPLFTPDAGKAEDTTDDRP